MTHTYTISGMSCNGCRTKVEKALNTIDGVEAIVTLDPPMATISMEKHVSLFKFQKALYEAGKYVITESEAIATKPKTEETPMAKSCCGGKSNHEDVVLPAKCFG